MAAGAGQNKIIAVDLIEKQPIRLGALVTRLTKHDTNPANNPQPPAHLR
jgi:hypothetical protein